MPTTSLKQNAKDLLYLSLPMSLSAATGVLTSITDSIMIGRLGVTHLAAIAVSSSIYIVFVVFTRGLSSSLPTLATKAIGNNDHDSRDRLVANSLILQLIAGIILTPVLFFIAKNLEFFRQPDDIASLSFEYLSIMSLAMIPLAIHQALQGAIEAHHNSKFPMIANYLACGINIFGNWLLIEGHWGFPAMGIKGAAIASLCSQILLCLILGVYLTKKYHSKFISYIGIHLSWNEMKRLFAIGFPFGIQWLIEVVAFSSTSVMLGAFDKTELAAHQIVLNFASLMFMIPLGLSSACAIKVSHAMSVMSLEKAIKYIKDCLITCWLLSLCTAALIFFSQSIVPPLYTDNQSVISLATSLMLIAALFQIADGTQAVSAGILRGLLDIKFPTLIITIAWWGITIPLSYVMAIHWKQGAFGIWIGLTVGLFLSGILLGLRIYLKLKHLQTQPSA